MMGRAARRKRERARAVVVEVGFLEVARCDDCGDLVAGHETARVTTIGSFDVGSGATFVTCGGAVCGELYRERQAAALGDQFARIMGGR